MTLEELAYRANLFKNDLQFMHWHAAGDDFDTVHAITNELYEEMATEVDDIVEMAITAGEDVGNMSSTAEHIDCDSQYEPLSDKAYCMDTFTAALAEKGKDYIDALTEVETNNSGDQSKIDEFINFWNKEVLYKNGARTICCDDKCEADYRDLMDPENDMYAGANDEDDEDNKSLDDGVTDMYSYNDAYANNYMSTDMVYSKGQEVDSPSFDDIGEPSDEAADEEADEQENTEPEEPTEDTGSEE